MAELADALASGASDRKVVQVQPLFRAPFFWLFLATDSICPKGWEMARYDGSGSWKLIISVNFSRFYSNEARTFVRIPYSFSYSGSYRLDTGNRSRLADIFYRTKIIMNGNNAYILYIASGAAANSGSTKGNGTSVRCVAKLVLDVRNSLFYCKML